MGRPKKVKSSSEKELDKAQKDFDKFDKNIKDLTVDRMNQHPKKETEDQTKIATKDLDKIDDVYLKPERRIGSSEKFNEDFKEKFEYDKEYVHFIAENKEILGEALEFWTKPYPGVAAEFWKIPVNTPVWAPRYVAEQIKRKFYHKLTMSQTTSTSQDGMGQYYGSLVVDETVARLDAKPVDTRRSIFMGATS